MNSITQVGVTINDMANQAGEGLRQLIQLVEQIADLDIDAADKAKLMRSQVNRKMRFINDELRTWEKREREMVDAAIDPVPVQPQINVMPEGTMPIATMDPRPFPEQEEERRAAQAGHSAP